MREHPTVAKNKQHRLDAALGIWQRVNGGYENYDGWRIHKDCNRNLWLITRPDGTPANLFLYYTLAHAKEVAAELIAAQ